ncbi:uncharacterized protein CEXT_645031 [Caerostris extrusa]|uniref:Uncharacterized protein n=1 Tax=Caerostris extrusa TaxID=172846 RepID=A0AAV4Q3G1_CAEEX|nr:uncharacterized protein CEXT_645031 [Caerostris extrusa]
MKFPQALSLLHHLSSIPGQSGLFTPDLSLLIGSVANVLTFRNYTASPKMAFNVKPLQSLKILLSACQMAIWWNGNNPPGPLVFRGDVPAHNETELWKYITLLPLDGFIVSIMGIIWHFRQERLRQIWGHFSSATSNLKKIHGSNLSRNR